MKRGYVMKQEQALSNQDIKPLSEVIVDTKNLLAPWICASLQIQPQEMSVLFSMGFFWKGHLVGGLIFSDYHLNHDVWWTIYTTDKRWCQKKTLKAIFKAAFEDLHCERIGVMVAFDNQDSLNLVKKLGFKQEGLMRRFRPEDKKDCFVFSMLKDECRYLS